MNDTIIETPTQQINNALKQSQPDIKAANEAINLIKEKLKKMEDMGLGHSTLSNFVNNLER